MSPVLDGGVGARGSRIRDGSVLPGVVEKGRKAVGYVVGGIKGLLVKEQETSVAFLGTELS